MTSETLEKQIIGLIATDRIEIPISSMSGKLKREKPKLAETIVLPESNKYNGERVYARIEEENKEKARTLREAIGEFCEKYPKYGDILKRIIAEKRIEKERHLYFGVKEGCRLTSEDYISVLTGIGFSQAIAEKLYPDLIEISRKLQEKRGKPERSILIGKVNNSED